MPSGVSLRRGRMFPAPVLLLLLLGWSAKTCAAPSLLKRIVPAEFERQLSASAPTMLVLFCPASVGLCKWVEKQLAGVAVQLAAERADVTVAMVDTAEWGGEALRLQYGEVHTSPTPATELIVFRHGLASVYRASLHTDKVLEHVRAMAGGRASTPTGRSRPNKHRSAGTAGAEAGTDSPERWSGSALELTDPGSVLELTTVNFGEAVRTYPLLFVLFFSTEKASGNFLHSNFSAAAYQLHEQHINARLAKMEIRKDWPEGQMLASRLGVTELPDIKIFRNAVPSEYQAGAGTVDIVDVARWNAGNLHATKGVGSSPSGAARLRSAVHEIEATSGFEQLLAKNTLVLLAFTTKWCTRCLMLASEFDAASSLLANAEPPVTLASVNLDNPRNQPLIERFGVLSFPIGKIFHRGRLISDFTGGSLAHEMVTEVGVVAS